MGDQQNRDANRDPLTGTPGAHPVGTGVGAAGGAASGAAIGGAVGGPVGAVAGAAIGGIAGGLAGKGAAEAMNPTVEDEYWARSYSTRPYVQTGEKYEDWRDAYRYGWESRQKYVGKKFGDVETDLSAGWNNVKGKSKLGWERAKLAAKDGWDRVERAMPGDFDKDGK